MIPSLLQIPSAVSDSKLHSVLPNNGKGDFTFDRSTGATRINKDGLIEEVGYFSSELVQNGNFSELGSELVTNGDFATDSDWTATTTDWTISNGKAIYQGSSNANLKQNSILVSGKTHKLVYEVVSNTCDGSLKLMGETVSGGLNISETVGVQTVYFVANGTQPTNFGFRVTGATTGVLEIDNVSVKQVDPNDRWTVSGVDIALDTNGIKLTTNDSSNGGIYQAVTTVVGSNYRLKLDFVAGNVNGIVQVGTSVFGGELYQNTSVTSNLIINFTATATTTYINLRVAASGATDKHCFYNNISIVEVQGDRPRLSYDITNGVVEDKPHLLLEPSATNLVTFSEDFSQSDWQKEGGATIESDVDTSPSGSINASYLKAPVTTNATVRITYTFSSTASQTYVGSIFVKKENVDYIRMLSTGATSSTLQAYYNVSNGTLGTSGTPAKATIEDYGNGWYRLGLIIDAVNTTSSASFRIQLAKSDGAGIDDFDGTEKNLIWGAMLEQQSYATSYIPTAGTTITRAAETCDNAKPSINNTVGVIYAEIAALVATAPTSQYISISDGTYNNRASILFSSGATDRIRCFLRVGGASQVDVTDTVTDVTDYNKVAFSYKANDFKVYINGTLVSSDTSGSVWSAGTVDTLSFSEINTTTGRFNGRVKGLALYGEELTDAQLIELTS